VHSSGVKSQPHRAFDCQTEKQKANATFKLKTGGGDCGSGRRILPTHIIIIIIIIIEKQSPHHHISAMKNCDVNVVLNDTSLITRGRRGGLKSPHPNEDRASALRESPPKREKNSVLCAAALWGYRVEALAERPPPNRIMTSHHSML
jgi:hypothetical protein